MKTKGSNPFIPSRHWLIVTLQLWLMRVSNYFRFWHTWLSLNISSSKWMQIPSYKYKYRHTSTNTVIQVQIPSYKYKFKQIFKKIGQTKALYLSYVFRRNFTLLLFLLERCKWKTNTSLSDYRTIGLSDCRTNGLSDYSLPPPPPPPSISNVKYGWHGSIKRS